MQNGAAAVKVPDRKNECALRNLTHCRGKMPFRCWAIFPCYAPHRRNGLLARPEGGVVWSQEFDIRDNTFVDQKVVKFQMLRWHRPLCLSINLVALATYNRATDRRRSTMAPTPITRRQIRCRSGLIEYIF